MDSIGSMVVTLVFLIVGSLFSAFGARLILTTIKELRKALASRAWLVTTGEVTFSRIGKIRSTGYDKDGFMYEFTYDSPEVIYTYGVGEVEYEGYSIRCGLPASREGEARPTIARYPAGSTVTVYYNPTHPAEAVLERGFQNMSLVWTVVMIAFGTFLASIGGAILLSILSELLSR